MANVQHPKLVERSDEDQCFIGTAPGLITGGCHGDDERAVFEELCQIVEEAVELYRSENRPLPPPPSVSEMLHLRSVAESRPL